MRYRIHSPASSSTAIANGTPITVILNYWNQNAVRGTWLESHFRWQIRTFWFAVMWIAVSLLMVITVIGVPFAIAVLLLAGLWILYRIVRGWWVLIQRRPLPMS